MKNERNHKILDSQSKAFKIIEHQVELPDGVIYYEESGEGRPVILIHGLSGSTRWWVKNVPVFAKQYHVIVIDLLGFGRGHGQRFILEDSARILTEWMQGLAIERPTLIGHSMGGYISAEIAANYPEWIDQLVLVDALAIPIKQSYFGQAYSLMRAARFAARDFIPVLIKDIWRAGPLTMSRAIRAVRRADLSDELQDISTPTLIIWGEHDIVLPVDMGQDLHQKIPNSHFVIIDGAGHNPMWDRPHDFNRIVLSYLESNQPELRRNGRMLNHDA